MKKILTTFILFGCIAFMNPSQAQININVNIGVQPSWGPVGYDHVEYYYIPDIRCYYYVPSHQFIYLRGNHWVFSNELPPPYRNFDLYHCHKVVINEPQPYLHYDEHRDQYDHYRGDPDGQVFIRDSRDDRYRDHWHDQQEADEEWRHHGHGEGRGRGHDRD